jgi:hypothetical protein
MGYYNDFKDNEFTSGTTQFQNLDVSFAALTKPKISYSLLRERVDERIEQDLNDMWLLLDGEDFEMDFSHGFWRDGKAFAMVNDGQVNLLSPKFSALNALLSVGIAIDIGV